MTEPIPSAVDARVQLVRDDKRALVATDEAAWGVALAMITARDVGVVLASTGASDVRCSIRYRPDRARGVSAISGQPRRSGRTALRRAR
ncbi:MAG: hypothetical protein JWR63_3070 [Conexibacter sp.]|nr:hypothetical protein [Conexibacter sp.]